MTPLGILLELSHLLIVQCLSWPFLYLISLFPFMFLFYPYLYNSFSMLLCLVCGYLPITCIIRKICLFYACMTPTPLHTRWVIRPYTRVCVRHRKWRSIFGHAGSPTRLITVKPHLEFSSFDETLSLVVLTATMFDIKEDDISRNLWKLCMTTFGSCH